MTITKRALVTAQCLLVAAAFSACTDNNTSEQEMDRQNVPQEQMDEQQSGVEQDGEPDCTGLTEEQCNELRQKMQEGEEAIQQGGESVEEGAGDVQRGAEDVTD